MKHVIFSCDRDGHLLDEESINIIIGMLFNSGIKVKRVLNCYKGFLETAFIALVKTDNEYQLVKSLARSNQQESILEIEPTGMGKLCYFDDRVPQYIGMWKEVRKIVGLNFTIDLETKKMYACV